MSFGTDIKIAWRNVWRNPRRSILSLAAIFLASTLLVFSICLQLSSYDLMIDAAVKTYTGHLQIQAPGYLKDKKMEQAVPSPRVVAGLLSGLDLVEAFSCRANGFALVSSRDRTYGVWVVGVEPDSEAAVSSIPRSIKRGRFLEDRRAHEAVLGTLLAQNLAVEPGDELVLLGQGLDGSTAATIVQVAGIFRTGQPDADRSLIQLPLQVFQETFAMGEAVHEVVVVGRDLERLPQLADSIRTALADALPDQALEVLTWQRIEPGIEQSIQVDMVSGWIFYGILVVIVGFGVMNTFLMSILERTREIGMLLALGMRRGHIARVAFLESFLMTLLGLACGITVGCLVTGYFQVHGIAIPQGEQILAQWGMPSRLYPRLTLFNVLLGPTFVLLTAGLAALLPLMRIARLQPVEAMRAV